MEQSISLAIGIRIGSWQPTRPPTSRNHPHKTSRSPRHRMKVHVFKNRVTQRPEKIILKTETGSDELFLQRLDQVLDGLSVVDFGGLHDSKDLWKFTPTKEHKTNQLELDFGDGLC
jgi:hypothetical protein